MTRVRAGEATARAGLANIIDAATVTASSSSTEDLFGNTEPHLVTASVMFNVDLARSDVAAQPIAEGDTLDVRLVPVESDKNFLRMDYQFSNKDEVVDSATNVTIADINLDARDSFKMTFRAINDPFTAKIHMPMDLNTAALRVWFDAHPEEGEVKEYFDKSSGTYNQVGDFGEGYFMYNLWVETELNQYDEFTVYDTPDVNLAFNGNLRLYVGRGHGEFTDLTLSRYQNYWVESNDTNEETRMEAWLYAVYFLTEEGRM